MNKNIINKIDKHFQNKSYCRLTREIGGDRMISTGFILDKSDKFVLIQESDEFRILGYQIFPIDTIIHIRYNKTDKKYQSILQQEGLLDSVQLKYKIDLSSWKSLFKDIKNTDLAIISECEHPDLEYFCIGYLKRINKESVSIRYFDAEGKLDKENTKHRFRDITKVSFDDHYANVFAKYVRNA